MCLSMFWHFLDVIWIGVFTFAYLLGVLRGGAPIRTATATIPRTGTATTTRTTITAAPRMARGANIGSASSSRCC